MSDHALRFLLLASFWSLVVASASGAPKPVQALDAADNYPVTIERTSIPRDELRQQTLLNMREFRAAYALSPVPHNTVLFLECYVNGQQVARYKSTFAMHWNQEKHGTGVISAAWLAEDKELVFLNDNGFQRYGGWVDRLKIPEEVFDEPSEVFCFQKPGPEFRERRPNLDDGKETVYPIVGICGKEHGKIGPFGSSVEDFIKGCSLYGVHRFIIVYMYLGKMSEHPGLQFDN